MATYQTDWGTRRAIGLPGQIANEEKCNKVSRTVESAAGIAFGQPAFRGSGDHGVVVGATFGATSVGSAAAGNTGDGTITAAPAVAAGAKQGRYVITIVEPAADAGEFTVEDPDGVLVGNGTVAVQFVGGGLTFTVADGAVNFVAGDQFYVDVTFSANADFLGLAVLNPAVPANSANPDAYPQYFTGAFMTMGVMYVTAGATVAAGDLVYWDPSDGRYTNTSTHVRIPGAVFETGGADGDIVEISLRLRG